MIIPDNKYSGPDNSGHEIYGAFSNSAPYTELEGRIPHSESKNKILNKYHCLISELSDEITNCEKERATLEYKRLEAMKNQSGPEPDDPGGALHDNVSQLDTQIRAISGKIDSLESHKRYYNKIIKYVMLILPDDM